MMSHSCINGIHGMIFILLYVDMDLMRSQINAITGAINTLKELLAKSIEDTRAIRELLEQCPICQLDEGK